MKLRILQLIDSFDQGGSEQQALELTRQLHDCGRYEVFLASLKADGVLRSTVADLKLGDVPAYPLQNFYDRNAITQLRRFVQHLRSWRIDLLHTHDFYTNIFGMTAGRLAGVKVRIASRRETNGLRSIGQQQVQRLAYSLADQIIANSESVKQKLLEEGINEERITVVHNGLNLERFTPPPDVSHEVALRSLGVPGISDSFTSFVTIVANMRHDVKDYPMFLRAAQRVSKAVPKVGFLLAGEGELQESLKQLAAELELEGNTFFLGHCENIAQLLSVSDVCVLSSKAEGFSNSILEYMAAGRPVVATSVGGAKEAISENETGYTVLSGNGVLMAERIISLLRDPAKARLMGKQGRRVVEERFSSAALLRNTEALYERLFASKQATIDRVKQNSPETGKAGLAPAAWLKDSHR
jgi:glycosyltransferase involved in cell wall biosynthesis